MYIRMLYRDGKAVGWYTGPSVVDIVKKVLKEYKQYESIFYKWQDGTQVILFQMKETKKTDESSGNHYEMAVDKEKLYDDQPEE